MQKVLIIQTAFIGDVILATALIEKLYAYYPHSQIDFLLRKGNESLLVGHPMLNKVWVWDKQKDKYKNWWVLLKSIRQEHYDLVVNVQRFASMGLFAALSNAKQIVGFQNNIFSFRFTYKHVHQIGNGTHEVIRNQSLITQFTDAKALKPRLYPTAYDEAQAQVWKKSPYICIAPTSVWFTKQFPKHKWIELILSLSKEINCYLLGSKSDSPICEEIIKHITTKDKERKIENLCGRFNLLTSAALMRDAMMNYVNDSAPMHLASAVNAPTCAIFCSTIPAFGFTPLSTISHIVQIEEQLACRPCGLHGHKHCPKKHFKCAENIDIQILANILPTNK
jgi:heptosyltransferase-2